MSERNLAVFILTHGRAYNVQTYHTLRRCGYTGKIYIVIDDEDDQEQDYRDLYGDEVVQFCKEDYLQKSMCINPDKPRKVILYARNACFDIAKELGITHFIEMDDDYSSFQWRYDDGSRLKVKETRSLDKVIDSFFNFMEISGASSVAFAQGGDMLGGRNGAISKSPVKRKAMNSFFCITKKPIGFIGSINEDVNTYVNKGNKGELFFTILMMILTQGTTQANKGGMTETYLERGTYVKSFPSVMLNPSCVKIGEMGQTEKRIHHKVYWRNAVPKIISDKYKKTSIR